jgi:cytochrome P450
MAMDEQQPAKMSQASVYDSLRVFQTVIVPTLAKGVIKRRPWIEAAAQHLGLDTDAVQLLQELRKKYGRGPLLLWLPFRSQVVLLDPKDVSQVLSETPIPFGSATKEKKSSLGHFEPNHILIADPERRAELRPVHEQALATNQRIHPLADRFTHVINSELQSLTNDTPILDYPTFSTTWFRIIRRLVLGDAARNDDTLTNALDAIRRRANWGFLLPADHTTLASVQTQLNHYISTREEGSLVSLLPTTPHATESLDLASQITHWLFAFDAAGIAAFRALALLACPDHAAHQARASDEAATGQAADRPFARTVFLESLRLWPTTPAILRELNTDSRLGSGVELSKGTGVVVFTPLFHRDGEVLEFADRLEPGLWMKEGQGEREVDLARALVPFSAGPAMCPAHNLVPMVGGLALGAVVGRGRLELVQPAMEGGRLPGTLDHSEVKLRVEKRAGGL